MKNHKYLIYFIMCSLGIAAALFGCITLAQKIQTSLDNQEQVQLENQIQNEQIANLPELSKTYQNILQNEGAFSIVYSEGKVVDIIRDMEQLARDSKVTLVITQKEVAVEKAGKEKSSEEEEGEAGSKKKVTPKTLEDTLPYEKHIRLEVQGKGSYRSLRDFMHKLETAPYTLDVLSVNANLAPVEDGAIIQSVNSRVDDSPFLLQGGGEAAEESAPNQTLQPRDVIVTFEIALYIQ